MAAGGRVTGTLDGWTATPFSAGGVTHDVYERGEGPGVVLVPEIPGMTPEVIGLADHLVASGFTVAVPSPFGEPGREAGAGSVARVLPRLCVSREFRAFATEVRRPFTDWLRALAADLAARTPGPGVGVIGMCFTGGFALATAVDGAVVAAVASQPGTPFPVGARRTANGGLSTEDLGIVAERAARGEVCAMGLRFSEDRGAPRARFDTLRRALGDRFEVIELDSSPGNAGGFARTAHSVLTNELRDVPGHPALEARERVVAFLRERLTA
ncbi:dienelactone hydrolase family protein [uncultured Amnibacterium sp.]|uniref:dienelactone hydrolase family protein n=1 Tax=uncultured Amnibacterium sp. TaxID=1631851 RepID=UPI0035CB8BA8